MFRPVSEILLAPPKCPSFPLMRLFSFSAEKDGLGGEHWRCRTTADIKRSDNRPDEHSGELDASWNFGPTGVWVMLPGLSHPLLRWQLGQ